LGTVLGFFLGGIAGYLSAVASEGPPNPGGHMIQGPDLTSLVDDLYSVIGGVIGAFLGVMVGSITETVIADRRSRRN
jgi:hypothetical protein